MRKDEGTMTIGDCSSKPDLAVDSGERAPAGIEGSWDRMDWQRMWLRAQSRSWRTLALVPGDEQTSTLEVAILMARLALSQGESLHVADMRELRLKHVDAYLEESRWEASKGERVIFATRSASANLATIPIARAADGAILCVSIGSTSLNAIRETVEQIGRQHFLGSLLVGECTESDSSSRALSLWRSAPGTRP
jgi:hypothetical protein